LSYVVLYQDVIVLSGIRIVFLVHIVLFSLFRTVYLYFRTLVTENNISSTINMKL
jgi:hypothetical protein